MAVDDAYVFPGFLNQYLHYFSFQGHRLLFIHASAEVRGENTPERNISSTGDQTHNHQVMSWTRSPLSLPGGAHIQSFPIKSALIENNFVFLLNMKNIQYLTLLNKFARQDRIFSLKSIFPGL